jgi:hypothetical protein
MQTYMAILICLVSSTDPEGERVSVEAGNKSQTFLTALSAMGERRLFLLDNKINGNPGMGLGPPGALEGDQLAVFGGVKTPFLVRRVEEGSSEAQGNEETFKLVGECYVDK